MLKNSKNTQIAQKSRKTPKFPEKMENTKSPEKSGPNTDLLGRRGAGQPPANHDVRSLCRRKPGEVWPPLPPQVPERSTTPRQPPRGATAFPVIVGRHLSDVASADRRPPPLCMADPHPTDFPKKSKSLIF